MLGYQWNKELCEYFNLTKEDYENKTIKAIMNLEEQMKREKIEDVHKRNATDEEFIRIVQTFFTPYEYLCKYFPENDVILACCRHLTLSDIVEEYPSEQGKCYYQPFEYLRNDYALLPQYDRSGRELAKRKRVMCSIYRIKNKYQGLRHGNVILDLLYGQYPQLKPFDFSAYSMDYNLKNYEIYPKNGIYTPFDALMSRDVEAIKKRNIDYGKSYRGSEYTEEKILERFANNEEFFKTILELED